ncbi:MAG: hypothetical protein V3U55_01150 [Mycobacterium sp.]
MSASKRVVLTTGFAALSLAALTATTAIPPMAMQNIQVVRPATFTAEVVADASGLPTEPPPSEDDLDSALALIEQLATVADGRVVTVRLDGGKDPGYVTIAPAAPNAQGDSAGNIGQGALEGPETQNTASDLIDSVYSVTRYWANYVSTELGPSLINWVPFGYLVSDQILIWYPDFVRPTVDSFVYDFLDPVVDDPLNLTVWVDGVSDIINTAATGVSDAISNEINYIVTLGWFPFPLPPAPDLALPGPAPVSVAAPTATEPPPSADTGGKVVVPEAVIEPADTVTDEEEATEPTHTVTEDEAAAAETVEKAAGENSETPAEDADEPAFDTDEPTLDAAEPAFDADEADESDTTEPSGDGADGSETTQPDSAPDAGEESGDNDSGGAAPNASASDGS